MPTSSELAQYRLLMQMQNQQNRIPFPTVTPTSGGAGVNFLQGLGGGLGYGIQRRQQGNSVEQLNQMMQAQAAAEQAAAQQQLVQTQALYQQLGINPALAGVSEDLQKTYLTQTGQTLNADLQGQRLQPLLQQTVQGPDGQLYQVPTQDARSIQINTTLGRTPEVVQGADAGYQASQNELDKLRRILTTLPKDKNGNLTPEGAQMYLQAATGVAPITPLDTLNKQTAVQQGQLGLQTTALQNQGIGIENQLKPLTAQKTALEIGKQTQDQATQAQVNQFGAQQQADVLAGRITPFQALQNTSVMAQTIGAQPVYNQAVFGTGKIEGNSPLNQLQGVYSEQQQQARDANKPKPIQFGPSPFQQDVGRLGQGIQTGAQNVLGGLLTRTGVMSPQQFQQIKAAPDPLQGITSYFMQPVAQQQPRPQRPSFVK